MLYNLAANLPEFKFESHKSKNQHDQSNFISAESEKFKWHANSAFDFKNLGVDDVLVWYGTGNLVGGYDEFAAWAQKCYAANVSIDSAVVDMIRIAV